MKNKNAGVQKQFFFFFLRTWPASTKKKLQNRPFYNGALKGNLEFSNLKFFLWCRVGPRSWHSINPNRSLTEGVQTRTKKKKMKKKKEKRKRKRKRHNEKTQKKRKSTSASVVALQTQASLRRNSILLLFFFLQGRFVFLDCGKWVPSGGVIFFLAVNVVHDVPWDRKIRKKYRRQVPWWKSTLNGPPGLFFWRLVGERLFPQSLDLGFRVPQSQGPSRMSIWFSSYMDSNQKPNKKRTNKKKVNSRRWRVESSCSTFYKKKNNEGLRNSFGLPWSPSKSRFVDHTHYHH